MVVFCAYCGKSFTRKEHLERHIPSHTNVKPHRCSSCQLSFARRDLLQRHHATYHEARDPMEPLPGGVPTVAGRTPIACQNCANAKTGCDKRVPCARCAEKNLPCAARFARRSSKAAVRAAQANAAFNNNGAMPPPPSQQTLVSPVAMMEIDVTMPNPACNTHSPPLLSPHGTMDPRMADNMHRITQHSPDPFSSPFSSPMARMDGFDDMLHFGNEFVAPDAGYQNLLLWPEYPLELDIYASQMQLVNTPLHTSFTDLSDMSSGSEPMTSSSSRGSNHTSATSNTSSGEYENMLKPMEHAATTTIIDGMIPEFNVVIAAESAWPMARCNSPIFSGSCPRTAIVHLECLEQKSKEDGTWSGLENFLEQVDWDSADLAMVVPMTPQTRDKILAITQSFLHKALEIHRGGLNGYHKSGFPSPPGNFNFIVLPPNEMLEYFLRSYIRSLSSYFNLVIGGCVDPNEMLLNNQASTLLVLLMIAQGASAVPTAEARYLAAGLTETCRISLFDVIEKNVEFSADPVALRCALLFTILGAWSGDKWLMDIAMGQRGMYISMLKHAGMLEPKVSIIPTLDGSTNPELQWRTWLHQELQYRLVYNWVMVDQELGLFHDTAPVLAITELQCPLPGPEALWMAASVEEWSSHAQKLCDAENTINPQMLNAPPISPSLCDLFQDFLHDNLSRRQSTLTPMHMRLLLHPLQSLLCHLQQMLSCFPDVLSSRCSSSRSVTKATTQLRLEEVQGLLQKWYELSMTLYKSHPGCYITHCNLILYHLISLDAVTNFPEIERLARREGFDGSYWDLAVRHKRCVSNREESIFHSGQVMRLVRSMSPDRRPSWWSAAIYRATLILWVESVSRLDTNFQKQQMHQSSPVPAPKMALGKDSPDGTATPDPRTPLLSGTHGGGGEPVAIDQVTPEDASIIAYLWSGDGVAVLTGPDGGTVGLDKSAGVVSYGVRAIGEGVSTRVGDGIRRKLVTLGNHWNVDGLGSVLG